MRGRGTTTALLALLSGVGPTLMLAAEGVRWWLIVALVVPYALISLAVHRHVERASGSPRPLREQIWLQALFAAPILAPLAAHLLPMVAWRGVLMTAPFLLTLLIEAQVLATITLRQVPPAEGMEPGRIPGGRLIAAAFLLITCIEAWGRWLPPVTDTLLEQRRMAEPPSLTLRTLLDRQGFREADAWCNDHFQFRNQLIVLSSLVQYRAFHQSILPDLVIVGQSPWLFYGGDRVLSDLHRDQPFADSELGTIQRNLDDLSAWCRSQGIDLLLVMPPNKESVYPEHLPWYLQGRLTSPSRLDQLLARIQDDPAIPYLDLRPVLRAAKPWARLYSYSDTHWNDCGAYAADAALCAELDRRYHLGLPVRSTGAEQVSFAIQDGGDLAHMIGLGGIVRNSVDTPTPWRVITEPHPRFSPPLVRQAVEVPDSAFARRRPQLTIREFTTPDRDRPSAYVIHDSFMEALGPFLSEHFSHTVYLWKEPANLDLDAQEISALHPTVLIIEVVERDWNLLLKPVVPAQGTGTAPAPGPAP